MSKIKTQMVQHLSEKFYADHPREQYPEILLKQNRPYKGLVIQTREYMIFVPFRSHISHQNAYLFKTSQRSIENRSGLDYSKSIIVTDPAYIGRDNVVVDEDEFREMQHNLPRITREAVAYVDDYIACQTDAPIHPRAYARKFGHTTLQYFHDLLGIT